MMFSTIVTALLATSADLQFQDWCKNVGIESLANLETTSRSVAGRGVFCRQDVNEGEVVINIPENVVLHQFNGAMNFPELAKQLKTRSVRLEESPDGGTDSFVATIILKTKNLLTRQIFGKQN